MWSRSLISTSAGLLLAAAAMTAGCGDLPTVEPPEARADARPVRLRLQTSGVSASLRGVAVWDGRSVWASGSEATLLRSVDGGETWTAVVVPGAEELDFRDVQLLGSETVLVMSAGPGVASRIYKTEDGGDSWRLVHANREEKAFFNGMAFWDDRSGVLTSDPIDGRLYLLRTEDGGETWDRIGDQSLPALLEGELGFAASGTGIATAGDSRVWIATGGSAARVFRSADGGLTWEVHPTPVAAGTASSGIFSIAFRDGMNGVAVGGDYENPELDRGNVAWTADGGRTWTLGEAAAGVEQKACVLSLGEGRYLAAGRTGLAVSEDDGRRWSRLEGPPFYAADFDPTSAVGWLVGSEGRIARFEMLP